MGITSAMAVKATLSRMNTRLATRSEQDQRHCESTRVHFDHCHETETLILRACHAPRKSSKNILQGCLKGERRSVGWWNAGWTMSKSGDPCSFRNLLKFKQSHWTIRLISLISIMSHLYYCATYLTLKSVVHTAPHKKKIKKNNNNN